MAAAEARITAAAAGARVAVQHLDLASLASVHRAAEALRANHPRIDLLINNAGRSHDAEAQQRLWEESERLTGIICPG